MRIFKNNKRSIYLEFYWPKIIFGREDFNEFSDDLIKKHSIEFDSRVFYVISRGPAFDENYWSFGLILLGFGASVIGEKHAKQTKNRLRGTTK